MLNDILSGSNIDLYNLSYRSIYTLRNDFIKAGGRYGNEFNDTDSPVTVFFRPFFYFSNNVTEYTSGSAHAGISNGNLLGLSNVKNGKYAFTNSAYDYLILNNELERASYLKSFIQLLSNISTYSPWYFSKVSGISEALSHKELTPKEFKIESERQKIEFECLPDAYDTRIGTLLDLYKNACFSFTQNKEVVPANLRKFDMGMYLFSAPINNMHKYDADDEGTPQNDSWALFGNYNDGVKDTSRYMTSSKYIEFTNCEIDITSCSTAFDTVDNGEGFTPVYKIVIYYDRCYETRYNEFMGQLVSEIIRYDFSPTRSDDLELISESSSRRRKREAENRLGAYHSSILDGMLDQLGSTVTSSLRSLTGRVALGNLYDVTSVSKIGDAASTVASGNILGAANQIKGMTENGNGISVGGVKVRTSSGWLKKNIEDPDNLSDTQKKSSKSFSLRPSQYVNQGLDALSGAIERKVGGGSESTGSNPVSNDQTMPGWDRRAIEGMRTKVKK